MDGRHVQSRGSIPKCVPALRSLRSIGVRTSCSGGDLDLRQAAGRSRPQLANIVSVAAIVSVAVVPALPMWLGDAFDRSDIIPSRRITVPADYGQVAPIISNTAGDFTTLVLPYGDNAGVIALNWNTLENGYLGIEPLRLMTRKPILTNDPTAPYLKLLVARITEGGKPALDALRLLNARFIVIHNDAHLEYLGNRLEWVGLNIDSLDDRLEALPGIQLVFASTSLRAYSWTGWRPYRFFAARPDTRPETRRPGPGIEGRERLEPWIYSAQTERRPIPYRVDNAGRYIVDTASLRPGEMLVMNQPFDTQWAADGVRPTKIDPGLTAFELDARGDVVVSHSLDERFPLLLAIVPLVLVACAVSLGWAMLSKRRTPQPRG